MRLMDVAAARKLLRVGRGADEATIKRAYRTQVLEHHPDVGGDPETFVRIQQAYDLLRASPAEQAGRQTAPSDSDIEARYQALLRAAEQRAAQAHRAAQEANRRARAAYGQETDEVEDSFAALLHDAVAQAEEQLGKLLDGAEPAGERAASAGRTLTDTLKARLSRLDGEDDSPESTRTPAAERELDRLKKLIRRVSEQPTEHP